MEGGGGSLDTCTMHTQEVKSCSRRKEEADLGRQTTTREEEGRNSTSSMVKRLTGACMVDMHFRGDWAGGCVPALLLEASHGWA